MSRRTAGRARPALLTDRVVEYGRRHGAVDLALGAPDYPPPPEVRDAAVAALGGSTAGYPHPWGDPVLRAVIRDRLAIDLGIDFCADREVTVTAGATEALFLILATVTRPGDGVLYFTPAYEGYRSLIRAVGARPRPVRLRHTGGRWSFDLDEFKIACGPRARAVLLNTPHNPTGKVFTDTELAEITAVGRTLTLVSDEIYAPLVYAGARHVSPAQLPGARPNVCLVGSLSKVFAVPGWRVGFVVAPPARTKAIRTLHDVVTAGTAAPLQRAAVTALRLPRSYFERLAADTWRRRDTLTAALRSAGLEPIVPESGWFTMVDFSARTAGADDLAFVRTLIATAGVTMVPGRAFYGATPAEGRGFIRICFGRSDALLAEALARLSNHFSGGQKRVI